MKKKSYLIVSLISIFCLSGCGTRLYNAPIIDRSAALKPVAYAPTPPGYYRVKPGDTLYRIATTYQRNVTDVAAWNNLSNPAQIEVNQLLRVVPPTNSETSAVATQPVQTNPVPVNSQITPEPSSSTLSSPSKPVVTSEKPSSQEASSVTSAAAKELRLIWPAQGPVLNRFDGNKNKGINIGGTIGEPILAAATGKVMYAGQGLRGYGNLIIIKHNESYLTAYAHNKTLLVQEGQTVTQGQKIAEMGNSDANRTMLHFEVRHASKPVDPLKYLPAE